MENASIISDLRRDDLGNFSYAAQDGNRVTVFSGSPNAAEFETLWTTLAALRDSQIKDKEEPAPAKKESLWRKFLNGLIALKDRVLPGRRAATQTGLPLQAPVFVGGGFAARTDANSKTGPNPGPSTPPPTVSNNKVPSVATPPIAKQVSAPQAVSPSAAAPGIFAVRTLRKLPDTGGYHVAFEDGIEVSVPPQSPYAAQFERILAISSKVDRSVQAAANSPTISVTAPNPSNNPTGPGNPDAPTPVDGMVREIARGANGKARFVFTKDNQDFPIKLTEKESRVLSSALKTGLVVEVTALSQPRTIITLESIKYKSGVNATIEQKFRNFVAEFKDASPSASTLTQAEVSESNQAKPSFIDNAIDAVNRYNTAIATNGTTFTKEESIPLLEKAFTDLADALQKDPNIAIPQQVIEFAGKSELKAAGNLLSAWELSGKQIQSPRTLVNTDGTQSAVDKVETGPADNAETPTTEEGAPIGPLPGELLETHQGEGDIPVDPAPAVSSTENNPPTVRIVEPELPFTPARVPVPEIDMGSPGD